MNELRLEPAAESNRPYRYEDPRALSQAWYDSLYGMRARTPSTPAPVQRPLVSADEAGAASTPSAPAGGQPAAERTRFDALRGRAAEDRTPWPGLQESRESEIEGADCTPRARAVRRRLARLTRFETPGREGEARMRFVVFEEGRRLRIVALCKRADRLRTEAVLERARTALRLEGAFVSYEVREA